MHSILRLTRQLSPSISSTTSTFRLLSTTTPTTPTTPTTSNLEFVQTEEKGLTFWIKMNRPQVHNAFNEHVIKELTTVFKTVNNKTNYRTVVLTGNGPSFSAGADLNWMKKMVNYTPEQNKQDSAQLWELINSIKECPIPVIARVNGPAYGGGVGLLAAADFAYSVKSAQFGLTEVGLGLIPAIISTFVLPKIGSHASRYFLTGERFGAAKAQQIGLVSEVYETEQDLDVAINKIIEIINKNSPQAVRAAKQLLKKVWGTSAQESRDYVIQAISDIRVSAEGQEGLKAFLEKRTPSWRSKV
jgi:methylglutaconyl-CoA hydratase